MAWDVQPSIGKSVGQAFAVYNRHVPATFMHRVVYITTDAMPSPTATRAKIIAYKKRLREAAMDRIVVIEQRRARLLEAMERIKQEIEDVERELAIASSEEIPTA